MAHCVWEMHTRTQQQPCTAEVFCRLSTDGHVECDMSGVAATLSSCHSLTGGVKVVLPGDTVPLHGALAQRGRTTLAGGRSAGEGRGPLAQFSVPRGAASPGQPSQCCLLVACRGGRDVATAG